MDTNPLVWTFEMTAAFIRVNSCLFVVVPFRLRGQNAGCLLKHVRSHYRRRLSTGNMGGPLSGPRDYDYRRTLCAGHVCHHDCAMRALGPDAVRVSIALFS